MRKLTKILIPLALLALLVCGFAFAVSAEAPTDRSDVAIAAHTSGETVNYYFTTAQLEAALDAAANNDVFDIYADVTLSTGAWGATQTTRGLVVNIHGVTVTYTGSAMLLENANGKYHRNGLTINGFTEGSNRAKLNITGKGVILENSTNASADDHGSPCYVNINNLDLTSNNYLFGLVRGNVTLTDSNVRTTHGSYSMYFKPTTAFTNGKDTGISVTLNNSTLTAAGASANNYSFPIYVHAQSAWPVYVSLTGESALVNETGKGSGMLHYGANAGNTLYVGKEVTHSAISSNSGTKLTVSVEEGYVAPNATPFGSFPIFAVDGSEISFVEVSGGYEAQKPKVLGDPIATRTADGVVTKYYMEDAPKFVADLVGAGNNVTFDIYAPMTISQGSWGTLTSRNLVINIHGVTVTYTGTEYVFDHTSKYARNGVEINGITVDGKRGALEITQSSAFMLVTEGNSTVEDDKSVAYINLNNVDITTASSLLDMRRGSVRIVDCVIKNTNGSYLMMLNGSTNHTNGNDTSVELYVEDSVLIAGGTQANKYAVPVYTQGDNFPVNVTLKGNTVLGTETDSQDSEYGINFSVYALNSNANSVIKADKTVSLYGRGFNCNAANTVVVEDGYVLSAAPNAVLKNTAGVSGSFVALGESEFVFVPESADRVVRLSKNANDINYTVVSGSSIVVKANLTLYNTIEYNIYVPTDVTFLAVNNIPVELKPIKIGGQDYYMAVLATFAANNAVHDFTVSISIENETSTQSIVKTLSVVDYLEVAMAQAKGNSLNLLANVARYLSVAYDFAGTDKTDAFEALLDKYADVIAALPTANLDSTGKADIGTITDAFEEATFNLEGIKIRFNIKEGYNGTVKIDGNEFVIVDGLCDELSYIEFDVRAFTLYNTGVKVAGDVNGTWNILNYVAGLEVDGEYTGDTATLVNALYYYAQAASTYKANPKG